MTEKRPNGYAMLEASRAIDDAQWGFSEVSNELPPLTLEQGKAVGKYGIAVYPSDPEPPHPPSTDPDDEIPEPEGDE